MLILLFSMPDGIGLDFCFKLLYGVFSGIHLERTVQYNLFSIIRYWEYGKFLKRWCWYFLLQTMLPRLCCFFSIKKVTGSKTIWCDTGCPEIPEAPQDILIGLMYEYYTFTIPVQISNNLNRFKRGLRTLCMKPFSTVLTKL